MPKKTNSYDFDRFRDQDRELKLLDYRASSRIELLIPTLRAAGLRANMRVLDVGSGTGRRALEIANYLSRGEVVGIDNSDELLLAARKLAPTARYKNLSFSKVDISSRRALEGLDGFDFIHMRLVIQHLPAPIETLRSMRRLLRRSGRIFIEDTDRDWMDVMPAPKGWPEIYSKMKAGQQKKGDPRSGRKLGHYLICAGFSDVNVALVPVCGGSSATLNWVRNYAPSYLNFLSSTEIPKAKRVLRGIERSANHGNVFFYQTWFQASARR